MNLTTLKLMALLIALTTAGIVACSDESSGMAGDNPLHDAEVARDVNEDPGGAMTGAATPTPSDQMPNAPPEVPHGPQGPEIPTQPQTPSDAAPPTPGAPPN